METRIVQVGRLSELVAELRPFGDVRVMEHYTRITTKGTQVQQLVLDVMGVNAADEVVWWHYDVELLLLPGGGEFWSEQGRAMAAAWPGLAEMVREVLTEACYNVLPGRYALPQGLTPLVGEVDELAVWDTKRLAFVWATPKAAEAAGTPGAE